MDWLQGVVDVLGYRQGEMELAAGEVVVRALVVYVAVVVIIRLGEKRFMGRNTAFDMVLAIMVGSVAARAVTGNSPLVTSLAGVAALVGLHWAVAAIAFRWNGFGTLIKGRSRELVRDGKLLDGGMSRSDITRHDLQEAMRRQGVIDLEEVASAHLERNGQVSVVPRRRREPRVVEVDVEDGVQRVKLEIG